MTHVVIAGAGIGGLAAALALAKTGCSVTVFEQAEALAEVGAGLQLSPNATRILDRLGVLEALLPSALEPEALRIRRGRDARVLACVPLGRIAQARWKAPTIVVHRADLQRVLLDAIAREPAVTLRLGATVTGFAQEGATVIAKGRQRDGDFAELGELLVGADGLRSRLRGEVVGAARDELRFTGRTAWRATIAAADAPAPARAPETNLWLGRDAHLVHYPLRRGTIVNIVAIIEEARAGDVDAAAQWNQPGSAELLRRRYGDWHGDARGLLEAASDWRRWPLFARPLLSRWSRGCVTLLGDAAHPMVPFLAQGAAQAIEDAAALAAAVAASPNDIPAALAAYEHERVARAHAVQRQSMRQGQIYHLTGPAAFARDLAMRAAGPETLIARYDWIYSR